MIETNLYSAYHLTRGLIGNMMERQEGHIFNICSTASITAYTNGGSYCISKFAMLGMSKVLREEMKPYHVRVTSILPGATLTDSWAGVEIPAERFMASDDVAQVIWTAYNLPSTTVLEEIVLRPQLGDL
jgi:NADP-dependent 3-hydroxy acid dehydrogenase YdfG